MRMDQSAKVFPTTDGDSHSTHSSQSRTVGRPPGFMDFDDEDADGFVTTQVTSFSPRQNWSDIEAKLMENVAFHLDDNVAGSAASKPHTSQDESDDEIVDGFLSENPEYQQSNLEKKLERYSAQLQVMKGRMAKWQARQTAYQDCIKQLEAQLKDQEAAFVEQEQAWEKEAMAMTSQFQRHPNAFQTIVHSNAGREELERQRAKEALRQMIHGAVEFDQDEMNDDDVGSVRKSRRQRFVLLLRRLSPFVHDVKQIEARFGTSVSAYFGFCRWVIFNYMLLVLPTVYNLTIHMLELVNHNYSEWGLFTGTTPTFLLYPSYTSNESVHYSVYLTAVCACFLVMSSHKWLREDRVAKLVQASDERHHYKFGKLILNAWDFETSSPQDAADLRTGIGEALEVALYDDIKQEMIRTRSKEDRYRLYARRSVATLVYLTTQGTCWALIVLLTVFSSKLQLAIKQQVPALTAYATSVVPLGVAAINGALPTIISLLTKFEKWDDQGFEIKAMLWSYGMLLDPYMLTTDVAPLEWLPLPFEIRSSVMIKFKSDTYKCRAEQVASGLIILVWTDFAVSKVSGIATASIKIGVDKLKRWRATKRAVSKADAAPSDTRAEFLIAPKMVALMYSCTLYQFSIPLAPVTAITSLVMLILSFKFDKFYLQTFQKKPMTPWSAKDAGTFFIKLYWTTVLIFLTCMHWFLSNATLPKTCGLQEANLSSSLCTPGTFDDATAVCSIRSTKHHTMRAYFLSQVESTDDLSECKAGYPACVCNTMLACGPFVNEYAGYDPLAQLLSTYDGVKIVFDLSTNQLVFVWVLVGFLFMQVMLKRNSVEAIELVSSMKDQENKSQLSVLLKKLQAQDKRLKLQRIQT
ncbi:hypothetical protein, variant [Aphanomyces invadans]|uniref:Uncharacterized protein n=1 Tax=Aphanomyces invadans TaxID=157072 RepID=A0A024UEF6_9STRA|nr:hypothetical protein, variant [Aphanomyces invadans]ETW04590.1 hypothetical protein, variant [Aphanomyces invadans]|eukprot:XP_008866027.1 hypothetical protein, variant [Aphanomyces invadans]